MHARPGRKEKPESDQSVVEDLYSKLSRYCQYLTQNRWDGEDLAQETMFKALKHYEPKKEFNAALLKKIAHNLWMDQLRKRNREVLGFVPNDNLREHKEDLSTLIEQIASTLTPKQTVIYTMKEGFQYQISEIAELFGMTDTAVKAILNRGRKRLSKLTEERSAPVPDYWSEEDFEEFKTRLMQAVRTENPEVLIKLIPVLFPIDQQPKLKLMKPSSPSSTLSMAA